MANVAASQLTTTYNKKYQPKKAHAIQQEEQKEVREIEDTCLEAFLARITDKQALFAAVLEKVKTEVCHGIDEKFLEDYLSTLDPRKILIEITPLCMKVKQGNGNAHRILLSSLHTQIEQECSRNRASLGAR